MKMKKILAFVMALAMMCGMLMSCDESAEALIEKADAALQEAPYTMTLKMNFECDNKEMSDILSMMNVEVPVTVDGKNIAMDMSMDVMGYEVNTDVKIVDAVMYYNMNMMGQNVKMKCTLTDTQYEEFMAKSNMQMPVSPENFAELKVEKKDGKKYIACGGITDDGLKLLNDVMKDALESTGGKAEVKDITYGITLADGKYESMDMSCTYAVTVAGETYNVSMTVGTDIAYGDVAEITVPSDADSYQEVNFSELMGS